MDITKRKVGLLAVNLALSWVSVYAHNFLAAPGNGLVTTIPDIGVSRAAYRSLSTPGQVDIYEFTALKGQEIYVQMTVPLLDRESGFAPEFAVVSMGTADAAFAPQDLQKGTVLDAPHDVVDQIHPHQGADETEPPSIAVAYDGSAPQVFDEPFTGTRYWIRQTVTLTAPADGTYRIGVYTRDGSTGKYVLAPGRREQFGFGDILSLPSVRIQVRDFCEVPTWPDYLVLTTLAVAVAAGIGFGVFALVAAL